MNSTTEQPKKGTVETAAGFAGRFIVRYTRNGKKFWDVMYSPTAEQARSDFLGLARELGWKVTDVSVEIREV